MDDYTAKLIERTETRRRQLESKADLSWMKGQDTRSSDTPKRETNVRPTGEAQRLRPLASKQKSEELTENTSTTSAVGGATVRLAKAAYELRSVNRASAALTANSLTQTQSSDTVKVAANNLNQSKPFVKATNSTELKTLRKPDVSHSSKTNACKESKSPLTEVNVKLRNVQKPTTTDVHASENKEQAGDSDYPKTMAQRLEIWQNRISRVEAQYAQVNQESTSATRRKRQVTRSSSRPRSCADVDMLDEPTVTTPVAKRVALAPTQTQTQDACGTPAAASSSPTAATAVANRTIERGRPPSDCVPLYGRPGTRITSTYYSAGAGASQPQTRSATRTDLEAKLNAFDFEPGNSIAKPSPCTVTVSKGDNVVFTPVATRQVAPFASEKVHYKLISNVIMSCNTGTKEPCSSASRKQRKSDSSVCETEQLTKQTGLESDSETGAAHLEALASTTDSARRRTRSSYGHANVELETRGKKSNEPNEAANTPKASVTPKPSTISMTKLGGALQLLGDGATSGSSLYTEITRELAAKQSDLASALLSEFSGVKANESHSNVVQPNQAAAAAQSPDWSAVTSLSDLEDEDLKPSMNSTKMHGHSYSAVVANANTNVCSPIPNAPDRTKAVHPHLTRRDRVPSKRGAGPSRDAPVESNVLAAQRHQPTRQRLLSLRSRVEQLLAMADQQDGIIKQASAALARCKQVQQRDATAKGTVTDSYAITLPLHEFIESNRVLLIACQRRQACLSAVELLKTKPPKEIGLDLDDPASGQRGSLTVSQLRFGLKREFIEQSGTFATEVHYVLVTLRIGSHVLVSQMVNTEHHVDQQSHCIDLPNRFQFEITPDFKLRLQVFCLTTAKDLGVVSSATDTLPRGAKRYKTAPDGTTVVHRVGQSPAKSTRSGKKAAKKKNSSNKPPGWSMAASSFSEVGSLELTMRSVSAGTFTFERTPTLLCPLDGLVYARLAMQMESGIESHGFLTMFEDVAGVGSWHRRWFQLKNDQLRFWRYPDDELRKEPLGVMRLDKCVNELVQLAPREKCARANTFELLILVRQIEPSNPPATSNARTKPQMLVYSYLLSADTKEDREAWCEKLNDNVAFLRTWYSDRMPKPFKQLTKRA